MNKTGLYEAYAQKVVEDMDIDDLMEAVTEHIENRLRDLPEAQALDEIRESVYSDLLDEYEKGKESAQ